MKKDVVLIVTATVFIILSAPFSEAVSIGASPGLIKFENMLRDGYAEQFLTVTTNNDGNLTAHYEISGEIEEWIRFQPEQEMFSFSKKSPYRLKLIATPPGDVANGEYNGYVRVVTDELSPMGGGVGSTVRAAIMIRTALQITDQQITKCYTGGILFKDSEEGFPIEFFATIVNQGNTRLRPRAAIDIWDQYQERIVLSEEFIGDEILPTVTETQRFQVTGRLPIGQYWVNVAFPECNFNRLLTFSIVEPGAVVDKGDLVYVKSKPWSYVNETVQIIALFQNSGPRSVMAKFKGSVTLDNEIKKLIETDTIRVEPNEQAELITYYAPELPGKYVISGRVIYNNKLTFEKGTVMNVNYREITRYHMRLKIIPVIIYLIILSCILFLIFRIRKKRKEKKRK
ncbi:hypothetical protein JXA85_01010 [Candidatus Woesearchaeota archaeon]|nr:hypothetical protein [Candidatus Woesearchaeota archaeon]